MRQFQFAYEDQDQLRAELTKIRQWTNSSVYSHIVFQIFTETLDEEILDGICSEISKQMPRAQFFGCSSNGNIIAGAFSEPDIGIVCTVFEYPSTKMELMQYTLTADTMDEVIDDVLKEIEKRPWVTAIELVTTIRGMSMTGFCNGLQKVRQDIQIFGGGAFSFDLYDNRACIFSKAGGMSENGVVFWLLGGEDFHVTSTFITGWKPLGKTFHVTMSDGNILYELDNVPAYEIYSKYLNIRNNEHFFYNSLEFPFFYHHNGIDILRAPTGSNPDGSLTMTSDIEEDVTAKLAYGDPWTILESVQTDGRTIKNFNPEIIQIFSCAARRTFWGNTEVSKESLPFQNIAPTSGFYTSSEFLRTNGYLNQHNVTLVVVGMREGTAAVKRSGELEIDQSGFSGKVSLINRLATYINAAFDELEQAAITDSLTRLHNRGEIQGRIDSRLLSGQLMTLLMLDIDNFKKVNDTYGHQEGDIVITSLASMLKSGIYENNPDADAGRWGGEEFMLLMPFDIEYSKLAAADILRDFNALNFPKAGHQTLSIGITQAKPDDTLDELLVRVDEALYQAKNQGKNRYVVL